jgi:replicative DNA helicase
VTTTELIPPQSCDAERQALGTLMRYPDKLEEVRDELAVADFYFDAHQKIYDAIQGLAVRGEPFDLIPLIEELRARGQLKDVRGDEYLAELLEVGTFNPDWSVKVITGKAILRDIIRACDESIGEAYAGSGPPDEVLDQAYARLDRIAARGVGPDATPIDQAVNRALDVIDARARGERMPGRPTGFADLDTVLCGGLGLGQLTTVAARPSVGKTSFSLNVTRHTCDAGASVLFVSLEQPEQELTERLLAMVSGVPGHRIRQGRFRPGDAGRLSTAADEVRRWKLTVIDRPGQTARQIAAAARRVRRKGKGLDLIVVDYLSLVEPDNCKANRNEQTGASARRLRDMARELGVPVLMCCQLNRDAADEKSAPRLHHLRDSGEIEQVSDAVIMLHRTGRGTDGMDRIQVHVAKQRNGPLAVVEFVHQTEVFTFREVGIES